MAPRLVAPKTGGKTSRMHRGVEVALLAVDIRPGVHPDFEAATASTNYGFYGTASVARPVAGQSATHEIRPVTAAAYGADDGIRTRDPHLGKVMLYQLSHVRVSR
jgi:hypothetical protein